MRFIKKLKMSISLLSYHINGNLKYKGLKEFRLIELKEENNSLQQKELFSLAGKKWSKMTDAEKKKYD